MLNNLHVKNLALIDEAEIEFGQGFNVLSGETGAGKSIIIGSLGLALGARADSDIIRQGAEYALVELALSTDNASVWDALSEIGIEHESDELLIQRRIYAGRSVCRVNGETITLKELSAVAQLLIDICGQRESVGLLKNAALKALLDEFGGEELAEVLRDIEANYKAYNKYLQELNSVDEDENLRRRKADLAQYEINEIDEAKLVSGEDIDLEDSYRRMSHASRINESLGVILGLCGSDYSNVGVTSALSRSLREIKSVTEYDDRLQDMESMLVDLEQLSNDLCREISDYMSESEYNPEEYSYVQDRLNLINRLKDKYGNSIEQILEYRDEKEKERVQLEDFDEYLSGLHQSIDKTRNILDGLNAKAHTIRTKAAEQLSDKLIESLRDMNFATCELRVVVNALEGTYSASGYDDIDFMISFNPGESLRPLSQIASGGELSRIMLAIKCVSAARDNIETMVFDEIDTGISGATAWKVAAKMSQLSKAFQVICITHQSQIAAFADSHYLIEKKADEGHTSTQIYRLSRSQMESELARMMGADETTEAALGAANDLKNRADKAKQLG